MIISKSDKYKIRNELIKYIYQKYQEYIPEPTGIYFKDQNNWNKSFDKIFPIFCVDNNITHII